MKISLLLSALFALTASAQTLPSTPKRPVVDTYFGKAVTFRNFANMFAFALWQAGHPDFQASAQQTEMAGRK